MVDACPARLLREEKWVSVFFGHNCFSYRTSPFDTSPCSNTSGSSTLSINRKTPHDDGCRDDYKRTLSHVAATDVCLEARAPRRVTQCLGRTWAVMSFQTPLICIFARDCIAMGISSRTACAAKDQSIYQQDRNQNTDNHLHLLRASCHLIESDISTLHPCPNTGTTRTRCAQS